MPAYNILIMGASYGSLLASKLLFGGHKVHLVCLPAEADDQRRGFRVRLRQGPQNTFEIDSRKLPARLAPRHGDVTPKTTIRGLPAGPQYRSPCVRELLDPWPSPSALHVDHEHAAAALSGGIPD